MFILSQKQLNKSGKLGIKNKNEIVYLFLILFCLKIIKLAAGNDANSNVNWDATEKAGENVDLK